MQKIEVRTPSPGSLWRAIGFGELDSGMTLERRVLAPSETLPPTAGMRDVWVAEGATALMDLHGEQSLGVGDLVTLAGEASLRAGAAGAVLWITTLPLAPPNRSMVTLFAAGDATILAGDLYTVKRRAAATDGHLGVLHFAIPPGGGPVPHIHHGEAEIFVVLDGRVRLYADGVRTHAAAGDVVCLPRGIPHGFHNATDQPAAMLCLLTPGGGEQFFIEAGRAPGPGATPKPDATEIARILALASRYRLEMLPHIADPYLP